VHLKGKVFVFGEHVNTDEIIAARYLTTSDQETLGRWCMEDIRPGFGSCGNARDAILVAGENFGCGSSREHAPLALLGCGIRAVVARSFARIFLRNAINIGLPVFEVPDWEGIVEGDTLDIDVEGGEIRLPQRRRTWSSVPYPPFLSQVVQQGGWIPFLLARQRGME